MSPAPAAPPLWLRALVRVDFVAAVLLTVLAPLALLAGAARRPAALAPLLRYWRASSLLMVTVYLLAGGRPHSPLCGVLARLLIARTLRDPAGAGPPYEGWRRVTRAYCLAGAALNLPMLPGLPGPGAALRAAYAEPPREFARLLHPRASAEQLGRAGDLGLAAFALGALIEVAVARRGAAGG